MFIPFPSEQTTWIACNCVMQIVRIEGMTVKDKLHSEIVSVFQAKDRVSITILPARYRTVRYFFPNHLL